MKTSECFCSFFRPVVRRDTFLAPSGSSRISTKTLGMRPSSTAHGNQYGTKSVTFKEILQHDFVADNIRGAQLEPARMYFQQVVYMLHQPNREWRSYARGCFKRLKHALLP